MKGNVFSTWLKEFCSLVLTQTVQAFLLSIVLLLVVISINSTSGSQYASISAGGILAIIALTSISKIEALIKKIFGIESSITDTSMKGGTHGMMGTIMAMKMAKKAFDNIPKIGSGIKDRINVNKEIKAANLDRLQSKNKELSRYNQLHGNSEAGDANGAVNGTNTTSDSAGGTYENSDTSGNTSRYSQLLGDSANGNANAAAASGQSNNGNANANATNNKELKARFDMEDKLEKIEKDYDQKLQELKKKKREANRKIVSGFTETGGAVAGGILGAAGKAVWAAGTGDDDILQEAARGLGIGAGVGDKIGQNIVNIPGNIREHSIEKKALNEKIGDYNSKIKALNKNIDEEMKKFNAGDI